MVNELFIFCKKIALVLDDLDTVEVRKYFWSGKIIKLMFLNINLIDNNLLFAIYIKLSRN